MTRIKARKSILPSFSFEIMNLSSFASTKPKKTFYMLYLSIVVYFHEINFIVTLLSHTCQIWILVDIWILSPRVKWTKSYLQMIKHCS